MTAILYRNNKAEATRSTVPVPKKPVPIDRAKRGLDKSDWYSTETGTLVEIDGLYSSDTHTQEVLTYELSNGVLTVTYVNTPIPAMTLWEREMAQSDSQMSRDLEDLWDAVGISKAPQVVKDKYDAKKAIRATRPA